MALKALPFSLPSDILFSRAPVYPLNSIFLVKGDVERALFLLSVLIPLKTLDILKPADTRLGARALSSFVLSKTSAILLPIKRPTKGHPH